MRISPFLSSLSFPAARLIEAAAASLLLLAGIFATPASADDVAGAQDYPAISRYAGSEIVNYDHAKFDDYDLLTGPVAQDGKPTSAQSLQGEIYRITYRNPAGRTSLEVFENYRKALKGAGASELFTCKNDKCGGRAFNSVIVDPTNYVRLGDRYDDQRFLAAKLKGDGKDVYVALFVTKGPGGDEPAFTQLHVIEVAAMDQSMVVVDASKIADEIDQKGSIALYGIHFDFNSAAIRPDSMPTLDQVAKFLGDKPSLKLVVVGHTDNVGGLDFNMKLSQQRAEAVRKALVTQYGIAPGRLQAWGAGYLAPVASNKTDEGRAKNRRVELVEQ